MEGTVTSTVTTTPNMGEVKNILRRNNIRVFGYRDKYILVDSNEVVFIMFEKIPENQYLNNSSPSIRMVNFPVSCRLSSLPIAEKVPFSMLSSADLKYMCDTYESSPIGYLNSKNFRERVNRLESKHKVSRKFAKILAALPKETNLSEVCYDIREASFYLKNKPDWKTILKDGTVDQQKRILHKLLTTETYEILQINKMAFSSISIVVHEIINIK